jgi:hypothetical protein
MAGHCPCLSVQVKAETGVGGPLPGMRGICPKFDTILFEPVEIGQGLMFVRAAIRRQHRNEQVTPMPVKSNPPAPVPAPRQPQQPAAPMRFNDWAML